LNTIAAMSQADCSLKVPLRVWIFSALGALAIHVGCVALAVANLRHDDNDDLGAPAIEIGVELMAPHLNPTDLPPGPSAEASAAAPPVEEQKSAVEPIDLPKAVPTETDDSDRIVALDDAKRPKEEAPEIKSAQTVPSVESTPVETTAPPSSEAVQESPQSVAPAQGAGENARRVRATWQKDLIAHLNKHKRYPPNHTNQDAQIVVGFVLDRTGHVLSTRIVKGSGDTAFDKAALAMLRRSDPVPVPPPLVADEGLRFTLPVIFRANGRS
jgi:periplasmic protein TonB